ncbi:hypothetical protein ACQKWADRAFT_304272 [Trichoderma austrokoningii]
MDEEGRSKIAAALRQYRETVLQHNLTLLRVLVDGLEQQPMPRMRAPSDIHFLQLIAFNRFGSFNFPESVKTLRDLLNDDVRAELITRNSLDGVCDTPIDSSKREEWFSKIKANIAGKNIDLGCEIEVPADLVYLCTLVDGITGSGMPYHTQTEIELLTPAEESDGLDYIVVPTWNDTEDREDILSGLWEDWEIALAFQIGKGPFALCGSCAIYCRHIEDNHKKEWKWRYAMFDGDWQTDMFDSIEEFLAYYAHHDEQTEEGIRRDIPKLACKGMMPPSSAFIMET